MEKSAQLHSRYNPQAEAARYIDSLDLKENIECFILIEPGLGYLVSALREKFIDSKIIALHADGGFPSCGVPSYYGTDESGIQEFLEKEVPETDISNIRIIEWRASLNHFGQLYVKLLSQTAEFLKRLDAGRRTTSVFGRRWIRNFFKNLDIVSKSVLYRTMNIPVIITGSGPSLEKALPVICKMQDECLIIAASSSVTALSHNGIRADIVIATDGGGWALRHIYTCFRNADNTEKTPLFAANLCAALPSQCAKSPLLLMSDGSFWQSIILKELSLPSVLVPQRGTVTASAVELAMILSGGNIYLGGMDLSVRDIRTHVRPYGFDYLLYEKENRFNSVYCRSFFRSDKIRNGGGLDIYASWFKKQRPLWQDRIFSLDGGSEIFKEALPQKRTEIKNTENYFNAVRVENEGGSLLRQRGRAALLSALKDSRYAKRLGEELIPLLFPSEKEAQAQELEARIIAVSGGDHHG